MSHFGPHPNWHSHLQLSLLMYCPGKTCFPAFLQRLSLQISLNQETARLPFRVAVMDSPWSSFGNCSNRWTGIESSGRSIWKCVEIIPDLKYESAESHWGKYWFSCFRNLDWKWHAETTGCKLCPFEDLLIWIFMSEYELLRHSRMLAMLELCIRLVAGYWSEQGGIFLPQRTTQRSHQTLWV